MRAMEFAAAALMCAGVAPDDAAGAEEAVVNGPRGELPSKVSFGGADPALPAAALREAAVAASGPGAVELAQPPRVQSASAAGW